MGQPTYALDPEQVRGLAQEIVHSAGTIQQELDGLNSALVGKIEQWTGADRDQYQLYQRQWSVTVAKMVAILNTNAAPALNRMVDNVESTERSNQNMFG